MMFALSNDGAVRISEAALAELKLVHLVSGIDGDAPPATMRRADGAPISGYTEWVSAGPPGVTIGWDWQMGAAPGSTLRRLGAPRCNLMLEDNIVKHASQYVLATLLCELIDKLAWQDVTETCLKDRYGI